MFTRANHIPTCSNIELDLAFRLGVLLLCLTLSGCGGGSSSDDIEISAGQGAADTDSTGAEPRISLMITAPARSQLIMDTTSEQVVQVGDESSNQSISSTISMDVSLEAVADAFKLTTIPTIQTITPASLDLSDLPLYRVTDTLDNQGVASQFERQRDIYDVLALDAFSFPVLALSVPDFAIGEGAVWSETSVLPLVTATTTTTVQSIDADSLSVLKRINTGTDQQRRYTISGTMQAVYSTSSLLMQSADVNLSIRFEDDVYVNGVLQRVTDTRTFRQVLREGT